MHNTWGNACFCSGCFSVAVPSAFPRRQNGHLHALKGTSQHWRPMALQWKEGRREEKRKRKNSEAQSCDSLLLDSPSSSLCFLCLSLAFLCQSASGPLASILLSPLGSHQSVDVASMLPLSANYTVYLTTLTVMPRRSLLLLLLIHGWAKNTSMSTYSQLMSVRRHLAAHNNNGNSYTTSCWHHSKIWHVFSGVMACYLSVLYRR